MKATQNTKMAFVIVNYNSADDLFDCVSSILNLATGNSRRIIVVDNASSDDSLKKISCFNEIDIIRLDSNLGFAVANNIACRNFSADYYFIFNADASFVNDFDIDRVIGILDKSTDVAICVTRLQYPDGSSQTSSFSYSSAAKWILQVIPGYKKLAKMVRDRDFILKSLALFSDNAASYKANHIGYKVDYSLLDADWVCGASMIVRGEYIREHGLFDENIFLYGEDEDLCLTAKKAGWRVALMNTPAVTHVHGWDSKKSSKNIQDRKYQSLSYFIQKHHRGLSLLIMRMLLPVYVYGWRGWFRRGRK